MPDFHTFNIECDVNRAHYNSYPKTNTKINLLNIFTKQNMYKLFLCLCLLCLVHYADAQLFSDYNFKFKTYTTANGLVHNTVKKCIADNNGFLWIITENGLSRFDGYEFKNFQHINGDSTSLPSNYLVDISVDENNRIFLAYMSGCCYYNPQTASFIKITNLKKDVPAQGIAYNKKYNQLFIATENGLLKYNIDKDLISKTNLTVKITGEISCLYLDNNDNAWLIAGRLGYYKYAIISDSYTYTKDAAMSIYQNKSTFYLSTWGNGFKRFDGNAEATEKDIVKQVSNQTKYGNIFVGCAINEKLTGSDILWVVTSTTGVALYSKSQHKFVKHFTNLLQNKDGLKTDFNWYVYTAPEGSLWICTWQGLVKVNPMNQQFESAELPELNGSYYNCISGIMDDPFEKDIAWMSVNGGGLAKFNKQQNKLLQWYFHPFGDPNDAKTYDKTWLISIIKDSNNVLWSPSYGGFAKVKKGNPTFLNLNHKGKLCYPNASYQDSKGNIWLAGRFVFQFNPYTQNNTVWNFPKSGHVYDFYAIAESPGGDIFIGGNNGLFKINTTTKQISQISFWKSEVDKAIWNNVKSLCCIGNELYIGSFAGLAKMNLATNETNVIGKEQYLNRVSYTSLYKSKDSMLWVYASNGLYRYDPAKKIFSVFNTSDGIYNLSNDPSIFFTYNDKTYLGYRMAYTRFDAGSIGTNPQSPIPYIVTSSIKNYNKAINSDKYLKLSYTQNDVTLDFTAIEYNFPEKINFSFKLDGFDAAWSTAAGLRTKSYTNLPAGDYTFKVKAFNNEGVAGESMATFHFKISPAFWQTWWFKALYILLFVAAVIMIAIKRVGLIRKKEAEKTAINKSLAELETKMLRSQMNPHFIFNSLNSVQKYIWENKEEDAAEYLASFAKLIRAILENSRKETISLKEEIDTMKLYVELEHRRSNGHFNYTIKVDESLVQQRVFLPPLIMQPFIENAIWHGLNKKEMTGNLLVELLQKNGQLVCIIDDDGIGRQQKTKIGLGGNKSLGVDITQQRIDRLMQTTHQNAGVVIEDKKENGLAAGTRVIITLPLQIQ